MGICTDCQYFRRAKPVSQILAAEFSTAHSDVSKELKTIQEDERKLRDTEADSMRLQASMGKQNFLNRPRMTDFCAFMESEGLFLIAELKNAGGRCENIRTEARPRKACADCANNIKSEGRQHDAKLEKLFVSQNISAVTVKASTSDAESALSRHRQDVTTRQAFEISSVVLNRGELPTRPGYLAYCRAFSTDDSFVVSALKNPYHTCEKWEAIMKPNANAAPSIGNTLQSTAVPVMTPPPMGFPIPPPPAANGAVADATLLGQLIGALEWLLDIVIPPPIRARIEAEIRGNFARNEQVEINGVVQLVQLFQSMQAQPPEVRVAVREAHQPEVVANMRANVDPTTQAMIALYDAANAPIAWGNPPLTREIANCYLDLIGFVQSLAVNVEWQPLPDAVRAQQIQMLAVQYPSMPPQQQQWLGGLPVGWTSMRAQWVMASPEMRGQLRMQILASMGVQAAPQYPSGYTPGYQQPMQQYGEPQPYAQAPYMAPPAQSEKSTDDLIHEILASDKEKEAEAANESPELAIQVRLQNSARNAQMLSNMMQMRHESMMAVARNIR